MTTDLYSSTRFAHLTLENRLAVAPMVTLFPEVVDCPTRHHMAFYARRAAGGAGLLIVGATYVSPEGKGFPNQMGIHSDEAIPMFGELAARIREHVPAILQLFHAGPKTSRRVTGNRVVAPSPMSSRGRRYDRAVAMTAADARTALVRFVSAARRARRAGFDGVELHGANGYLLNAFSDPLLNGRPDEWGDLTAWPLAVVRRIRDELPRPFLIGYTLTPFPANQHQPDAGSLERFVALAHGLQGAGADYIHVYRGKEEESRTRPQIVFASMLRCAGVVLPIIEGAGIRNAAQAVRFIRGGATLAAIGRALLGMPNLLSRRDFEYPSEDLAALSTSVALQRVFDSEFFTSGGSTLTPVCHHRPSDGRGR